MPIHLLVNEETYRRRIARPSRWPAWLAFTAGVVVGTGAFVAVHAVRRRAQGTPPPGPSGGPGELPVAAGPEPPTPAPVHRLRALLLVAVLLAVPAGFTVYRHTARTSETATPYSPLLVRTPVPWLLPTGNPPDRPTTTPDDSIAARSGLVPRTSTVSMRRLDGDRMTVSIADVVNAQPRTHRTLPAYPSLRPAPGKRLLYVEVAVRNTGHTSFPEHIGFFRGSVCDRDGHVHQPNARLTDAANTGPEPAPLAPGWLAVGILVFEVKEATRVTSFRFGPWPAVSRQTQQWSLADG